MFDSLSERLQEIIKKTAGNAQLSEENMQDALREIRRALLGADVSLGVVKSFISNIKDKALGQDVIKSVNPSQMLIKIVNDELVELLGKEKKPSGDPIVHRTLSFFELHLPLYLSNVSGEYEREWRRDYVSFLGVRLPIYVTTATFQPIREEAFSLDQQQAEEKAQKLLEEKEKSAFQNMQVKRKEIEIVRKNNKIIITGRYLCEESIALCEKIDKIS